MKTLSITWILISLTYSFFPPSANACSLFINTDQINNYNLVYFPAKDIYLDAVLNEKSVLLNWATDIDIQAGHFEIERSFDQHNFKTVGLILDAYAAKGLLKMYQFKENKSEWKGKTIAYYRLKQIDASGNVAYNPVLTVKLSKDAAKMQVSDKIKTASITKPFSIQFNAMEKGLVTIEIADLPGQTLLKKQAMLNKGNNEVQLEELANLSTGVYMAQLMMNGKVAGYKKVVKI